MASKAKTGPTPPAPAARRVAVSAQLAALILPFASTSETRFQLNGIFIEPHPDGGVVIVATDGHLLGAVRDPDGRANAPWICPVPPLLAAACRRQATRKNMQAELAARLHFVGNVGHVTNGRFADDGDPAEIGMGHMASEYAPAIDGAYPDWRRVLPEWPRRARMRASTFNPDYAGAFRAAAKAAGYPHSMVTVFPGDGAGHAMIVRLDGLPEFLGIWMPARCGLDEASQADGLPAWLRGMKPKGRHARRAGKAA